LVVTISSTEIDSLNRYVPRVASEWDVDAPDRLWQEIDSTLCFVDLSGFTKLSERLARRGRIGAEELTDVLNRVFGRMLELAYERGGALLKFGGDALLLQFVGNEHAVHASCAAVEMRAALREAAQIKTSVGRVPLRMSVGIHSGIVHVFKVGSSHRELVVTGPAATRVALMESTADAGEILVSPETALRLPFGAVGAAKGDGLLLRWRRGPIASPGALPRRSVAVDAIADCLPVVLRGYLAQGTTEAEHRVATVGFVKFQGVDALMESSGPEGVAESLHEVVSVVQHAVDAAGVTLLGSDLDKDGGKLILVTGVPATQGDDDGRMLRALRDILEANTRLPVRVGVNRGHVFAGEVGAAHRATFTVMGDTVNLAARLMSTAGTGEMYVTPEVLDRSRTLFTTTALEPFFVRGKSMPVQAYSVGEEIGPRTPAMAHELPFVGRDSEIDVLARAIARVASGQGSVVTIVGETGVGKTRLIDEAKKIADGLITIGVHAEQAGSSSPYRAFRDPIRQLLRVERAEQLAMEARLRQAVTDRAPELLPVLPLLGDVTHIDVPSTERVDDIELRFRPDRTADAVVALLAASHRGPMLLIMEDAQWMDSASVGLIERLIRAVRDHPWLIIIARRPEPGGVDPRHGERIDLRPLGADESTAIVITATSAAPLRPHEIDLLVQRSGGSPLFLGEMLRMARNSRVEDLPESLDAVVNAELDALGVLARRLVRYASVLGCSFRVSVLRELVADDQIDLDDATTRELGRFLEYEGTDRARFRHAMHRDVAYQGLPFRRRRELHLRAGRITERDAGDNPETVADVLSLHYALAHEHAQAWRYARIAGDRARDRYANLEAASQYERAIEAARRLDIPLADQLVDVWRVLGDVREQLALFEDAIEAYRRAARMVDGDRVVDADLLWRRSRARMHLGAYRTALAEATKGQRMLVDLDDADAQAVRARLTALQALLRQSQQRAEPARRLADRAIVEALSAPDDAALARAYLVSDWANRVLGSSEVSGYGEMALALYERLGDLDGAGKASNNLGAIAYFDGQWDDAVRWYRKALDAYHRCGNEASTAVAGSNLAEVLISRRAFDEAEPMLRESIRVLRASHSLDDVLFAEIQLGRLLVERGDHAAALEHLVAVRAEAAAVGQLGYAFEAATHLASALVALNRFDEAIQTLDDASKLVGSVDPVYQPTLARVRALALAGNGRLDEGRALLAGGLSSARSQGLAYEEGLMLITSIQLDRIDGRRSPSEVIDRLSTILARLHVEIEVPDLANY
jgi:class 3 adenylate cyclase/tetratricopeptide (TPR) repeat protein